MEANPLDYVYDEESYPNIWTCAVKHPVTKYRWLFELSHRRNDLPAFFQFLTVLRNNGCRTVGFNNLGFDYPLIHFILHYQSQLNPLIINQFVASIIDVPHHDRFKHIIWDRDQYVPQIDLYKIHHFDNQARSTSLKVLEFNMRSRNIQELPYPPGTYLTEPQMDELIHYNHHDVDETEAFYFKSLGAIKFREELTAKYGRNFLNDNDTKIGKAYFIMRLEEARPGTCYEQGANGRRKPRQTRRQFIALKDVIFPWISFRRPQFQLVHQWLAAQVLTKEQFDQFGKEIDEDDDSPIKTKGLFSKITVDRLGGLAQYSQLQRNGVAKTLNCIVDGFRFDFGTGGIHGSVTARQLCSDDTHVVIDIDVESYYPNLGIKNKLYPAHLGELFPVIYEDVFEQRKSHTKGTAENAMLKLALNGVYGDSNNQYSPFYDPAYTMAITINGQLLLCLLAEYLMDIPGLEVIQVNTDGLTARLPRTAVGMLNAVCDWWQSHTLLKLEQAEYSRMWIADVNSYLAEKTDGKLKRKGRYAWKFDYKTGKNDKGAGDLDWHQNHSALVIPMAAEAALVRGVPVREFILGHADIMDFMLRVKVPRTMKLVTVSDGVERLLQNITRYFVSKTGGSLIKIMPPLARKPDQIRRTGVTVGWLCTECNRIDGQVTRDQINMEYYIQEAEKLVKPLLGG